MLQITLLSNQGHLTYQMKYSTLYALDYITLKPELLSIMRRLSTLYALDYITLKLLTKLINGCFMYLICFRLHYSQTQICSFLLSLVVPYMLQITLLSNRFVFSCCCSFCTLYALDYITLKPDRTYLQILLRTLYALDYITLKRGCSQHCTQTMYLICFRLHYSQTALLQMQKLKEYLICFRLHYSQTLLNDFCHSLKYLICFRLHYSQTGEIRFRFQRCTLYALDYITLKHIFNNI